jgi:hypothetical protein
MKNGRMRAILTGRLTTAPNPQVAIKPDSEVKLMIAFFAPVDQAGDRTLAISGGAV